MVVFHTVVVQNASVVLWAEGEAEPSAELFLTRIVV